MNELLPISLLISLAKKRGIYLGKGTPENRVAYFVKTGLIPYAIRKTNPRTGRIEAHFPFSILETIEEINHLKRKKYQHEHIKNVLNLDVSPTTDIQVYKYTSDLFKSSKFRTSGKFLVASFLVLFIAVLYTNFILGLASPQGSKVLGVKDFIAPVVSEEGPLGGLISKAGSLFNIFKGGSFVIPLLGKSELQTPSDLSVAGKASIAKDIEGLGNLKISGIASVGKLVTGIVDPYLIENDGTVQSTLQIKSVGNISLEPGGSVNISGDLKSNNITVNSSETIGGNLSLTSTSPTISIGNTGVLKITDGTNTLLKLTDNGTTGNLETTGDLKVDGNITLTGVINSNTLTDTKLVFAGSSPSIYAGTTNTGISLNANGTGAISIGNSSTGDIYLGGGSSATTRCFVTNSSGNINCTGTGTFSSVSLTTVLSVGNGGTGKSTLTSNGVLYGQGTSAIGITSQGTSGQLLVANSSQVPTFVSLSSDATLSSTGAFTLASTGVTAASYGGSTAIPVITVDAKGRITAASTASISSAWSSITDPTANLALSMAAYTTTFTYNAATGASTNLFNLTDTASNTGTGYLLNISTASLSTLLPFRVQARGNTIIDTTATGGVTIGNSTSAQAITIDAGTATLNVGNSNNARTINIGTGTAADTINIGTGGTTADTISIGGLSTTAINTTGVLSHTGTGSFSSTLTASNGLTLTTGALNLTATSGTESLTLSSSTTAFNVNSGVFDIDTTNSRVGIGTTAPDSILQVGSGTTAFGFANRRLSVIGAGQTDILVQDSSSSTTGSLYALSSQVVLRAATNHPLLFATNNIERWRIDATGNFITGTDNSFDIGASGATRPRSIYLGTLTAASATTVCRDANGGLSTCSSSRKFKDNITYLSDNQLSDILGQITDSKLATFTYKTDRPDLTRYGLIAEEAPLPLRMIDPNGNNNIDFYSAQLGYTWAGIKALNQKLATDEGRLVDLESSNKKLLTVVGLPTPTPTPTPTPLPSSGQATLSILSRLDTLEKTVLASSSASFDNLTVLKKLLTTDLGITGKISVGLLAINGLDPSASNAATLNTLSGDLNLQNLGIGGINFLSGKILIDKEGNLKTINSIIAKKYKIDISDTTSSSLGSGVLTAGTNSVTISTAAVTDSSKIFITPVSDTDKPLIVKNKVAGKSFDVTIPAPYTANITFDWFIIN